MTKISRLSIISTSPAITIRIGAIIGRCLTPGWAVALQGELGAGKTWLTKGIAQGMGLDCRYEITSPTFTLINEYPGAIQLFHMDAYRLRGVEDLEDLNYEEIRESRGVWVIEWADKIRDELPEPTLNIAICYQSDSTRELILSAEPIIIEEIYNLLIKEEHLNGINRPEVRRDISC